MMCSSITDLLTMRNSWQTLFLGKDSKMKERTVLITTLLAITSLAHAQTHTEGILCSITKSTHKTNPVETSAAISKAIPHEMYLIINSSGLEKSAATNLVLKACKTFVNGDIQRIFDAGKAYEKQFGNPLRVDEPVSEEATNRAKWLRGWLSQQVNLGGTLVLVGDQRSLPTWHVRLGHMHCTTDSFYADLDGNGVPETAVSRILGAPELMVRQMKGKDNYGQKAAILCSEDTRIHLETRAFTKQLSRLGYTVAICGASSEEALTESDLIIHFGHGTSKRISNRFGESFVSAETMPTLTRSPIVFVDGCGTLPVGSPLLRAFLEQGAIAYVGSTETVQGMIPARFTNELVEHFLQMMKHTPGSTIAQTLVAARAAYVKGHPGLADKLRTLALTGSVDVHGDEATDLLTVAEWVYYGDPRAVLPCVGKPKELCREVFRLTEPVQLDQVNSSWQCSFTSKRGDGQAVLALYADIPIADRTNFKLSVSHNLKRIADLDSHRDTRYQNIGQDCRGGYLCDETYRTRFLVPFDPSVGNQDLKVHLANGSSANLTPGTMIDIWPANFDKMIGLRHAPNRIDIRSRRREPVKAVGLGKLHVMGAAGFLSLDLSSVFNRPHNSVQVGGGDNASFKTWFTKDMVFADGIPFHFRRTEQDVLVSANNTQNVFEIKGFATCAHRVHFLLWGYNRPRQPARLSIHFKDGSSQTCSIPLSEWTRVQPPVAFDFENTVPVFRHAAIAHHVVEIESPEKEVVSISSISGTYGLIAITFEE